MILQFGIDQLIASPEKLAGKKVGLITNDAAKTSNLQPGRKALAEAGIGLVLLFSPEHGLEATGKDGASMPDSTDPLTNLPVISIYGQQIKPDIGLLQTLDVLLFDLPDIGSRFYTYIWTLSYVMESCAEANLPLIILDRPNPISGNLTLSEGPMLDEERFSSFIGRWNIPIRHSLTVGELALFWKATKFIDADLTIIPVKGWKRAQFYHELNVTFVPTSPAISNAETALIYPGTCLFEGINISEGRGTNSPFKCIGAPWMQAGKLAEAIKTLSLNGLAVQPVTFIPAEGEYENQRCEGVELFITDYQTFRPVETGLTIMAVIREMYPENFQWAAYPTNVNKTGSGHFDLLMGQDYVRKVFEQNPEQFRQEIKKFTDVSDWNDRVRDFLLYD
ncbi:Uncharacterized conserved protein YbbC, DUF1343 family [Pseudarcicella hirudinis]|uniref:Uncharacterized conserved protein YbbC, DUF1343 family n=1 Tax=Pseudarcicella hirudinis TaxID=1079859 RepID=A0A1I5YT08_9BACT|nr:DUF1343 domain-containing protein [Pseudarcicella hirudinis]SFQ47007.1 Uncharacterized conserved protein YbbC, DUF1343 family [Pseudarcicella hirudinis]